MIKVSQIYEEVSEKSQDMSEAIFECVSLNTDKVVKDTHNVEMFSFKLVHFGCLFFSTSLCITHRPRNNFIVVLPMAEVSQIYEEARK